MGTMGKSEPSAQWSRSDWKTEKLQMYWSASWFFEVADVVGDLVRLEREGHLLHALGGLPEERLDLGLDVEVEEAELEHLLRLLLDLEEVVPGLRAGSCWVRWSWV